MGAALDFGFQKETIKFGIANEYAIYALGMGLGKSFCAASTAVQTRSTCLIVCPAYLRLKWHSEIKKFFPDATVSVFLNDKEFYPVWDTDFVIISYNYVDKAEILFEWADMVVFDEGHMLKTIGAKRTDASHRLVFENSIKRVLILTGTPIQNRVYEFYSLIAMCNYNPKFGDKTEFLERFPSYVDFANYFSYLEEFEVFNAKTNKKVKVQQWVGYQNIEELKEKYLKDIYIRFGPEVLGLEEPIHVEVPVSYEENSQLMKDFERFTREGGETSVMSSVKAKAALSKVPFTVDYVKNLLEQCEQVVVYTDHVEACLELAKRLGAVAITGQTSVNRRQELADEFMAGKSRVIVATIGSFSTGIDLISAFNMVFNDFNWVPGNMEQAMYRIRRIGQTVRCVFHYIMGSHQDKVIWETLKEKIEVIRKVV